MTNRLYPNEYPTVGDTVVARITRIEDANVYCHLLEYDHEGMIPAHALTKFKLRNVRKHVKVGAQECLEVIEVNADKGYIDLSKRDIHAEDAEIALNRYTFARKVYSFFRRWSEKTGVNMVETILWPVYDEEEDNVYMHIRDMDWLTGVTADVKENISEEFDKLFVQKAQKLERKFEMLSYDPHGAEVVQSAIDAGVACATEDVPLQCIYTGTSGKAGTVYLLTTTSSSEFAEAILFKAMVKIRETIGDTGLVQE